MKNEQQLEELIDKYKRKTCTAAEAALVEQWLMALHRDSPVVPSPEEITEVQARMRAKLMNHIEAGGVVPTQKKKTVFYKWAAAAAILLCLSIGLYLYQKAPAPQADGQITNTTISPAKKSATLTLANGQKILLNDANAGELAQEAGVKISKTANGEVVYEILDGQNPNAAINAKNVLSTAKGETYMIVLPDKSKVWLNAASSLTYAANFTATRERQVELDGEAYFEIETATDRAGKKIPFFVKTATQQVEVLGTHFSVNSYADEPVVRTTLIEGAVKVQHNRGNLASARLKAGEQSITNENGITVKAVDTETFIDWKNSIFIFKNETLPSIMRRIGRWYNVTIEYPEGIPANEAFEGRLSRFDQVNTVLNMLEETGDVQFTIKDRRILVYPKKNSPINQTQEDK